MKFKPEEFWGIIRKPIKVGSNVRVRKGVDKYIITTPGSEGFVTSISMGGNFCQVEFYKMTGQRNDDGRDCFSLETKDLEVIE